MGGGEGRGGTHGRGLGRWRRIGGGVAFFASRGVGGAGLGTGRRGVGGWVAEGWLAHGVRGGWSWMPREELEAKRGGEGFG